MEKVICFDSANGQFRLYFPKSGSILASVRQLPVRQFQRLEDDAFWTAGNDAPTAVALAKLAFVHDFIVDSVAANKIAEAFDAAKAVRPASASSFNVTARFSAGILIGIIVKSPYNADLVETLRSLAGSKFDKTAGWTVPAHERAIRSVLTLGREFDLSVDPVLIEAIQSQLKKQTPQGYAQLCVELDALIGAAEHTYATASLKAATPKSVPPFAVLPAAFVSNWVTNAPARQKKAREAVIGERVGRRAAARALDRGFESEALGMTAHQVQAVHSNLRALAGVCDGAATVDSIGFNGPDAKVGRGLALLPALEPIHAAYARSFLKKYTRQLGDAAIDAMS